MVLNTLKRLLEYLRKFKINKLLFKEFYINKFCFIIVSAFFKYMKKMGMQAVDLAIKNGVDLDGTPIPQKMLDLYKRIMDEENKRQRSGVKKSMRNRCVKTGSKHFDKETLNQLLIDSGWEGLKEKEILFFYS